MKYIIAFIVTGLLCACGCKKEAQRKMDANYRPDVSPAKFTASTTLTNSYFPVAAGKKYVYEGQTPDGLERVEEQRLASTKTIMGIVCIVVNFKAYVNGKLVEEAWDWYAQDNEGNVWYFGEAVDNYGSNGAIKNHAGSWEAGVDGAQPGMIMPANPSVGKKYREEYYFNHAEDEAEVIETGVTATIPFGMFSNCIKTKNWTELEPALLEHKYYAPSVGLVKEVNVTDNYEIRLVAIQ